MRNKSKSWYLGLVSVFIVLSLVLPTQIAWIKVIAVQKPKPVSTKQLKPEDLTFRKVFSYRNLFNSEVLINQMDFEEFAAAGDGQLTKTIKDGKMKVENQTDNKLTERLELGGHAPYSTYDFEVTQQDIGSKAGLELYKDDNNRILLSEGKADSKADLSFNRIISRVPMNSLENVTVYQDIANNTLEITENGLKFNGDAGVRGENFVLIDEAKRGSAYRVSVNAQSADYGNAILKLRKDGQNGIFLVTQANGTLGYEIFKNGSSTTGFQIINTTAPDKPYQMEIVIDGTELVFSRYTKDGLQAAKRVDVGPHFDLSRPEILQQFEAVFGARGGNGNYIEYSDAFAAKIEVDSYSLDFDGDLTEYNDQTIQNELERTGSGLRFKGTSDGRGENFVSIGAVEQGLAYEAVVSDQSESYGNAILKLRKDHQNGIFLVTTASGELRYEIFKGGSSQGGSKLIYDEAPIKPYTMQIAIDGKNLIFSRYTGGELQVRKTVDVRGSFDFTDPNIRKQFEAVFGGRCGEDNFIEYTYAGIKAAGSEQEQDANHSKLKLEVYSNGVRKKELVFNPKKMNYPYTIRADFAAESIGTNTRCGFLSVWTVKDGKAELLEKNIELGGIDFSNPEVVEQYKANMYYEMNAGTSVEISDFRHYYTGGAAQADPKPLHDETGALLQEGDIIWLAMTVRGYDIHSSYQGVYSFNVKTGELKLLSIMAFNLEGRGRFAPYHAADIIYNRIADEWIVMPTAHNESPHAIKSGQIPEDPRTTPFQFVDVKKANYPDQENEEDASLIFDKEAGKWRLVMCDRRGDGYQLPLLEADTWDGEYKEIKRYAKSPCTGIQLQQLDGQYYVFFGRNTDNCEALRYPQMDQPVKLNIESSPRSYNVWPVIIPFKDTELGVTRYFMLSFDREQHGGQHSYGNIYLYEAEQYPGRADSEVKEGTKNPEIIENGEITTANQLEQIRNNLDGAYILKNHIDLSKIKNWVPIGDKENPFTGSLDGNGFNITGLNINRPNTDDAGLFGHIAPDGVIKDITLSQAQVKGRNYVGLLAGYNEGMIQNSRVYGNAEAFSTGGILVGQNTGRIEYSSSGGTVKSTGADSIGGLVGNNSANIGAIDLAKKGIINNCYSLSDVQGRMNTGGFVGYNDCGAIANSYAKGSVIGVANVGGFIGNSGRNYENASRVPVSYCYSVANVKGQYNTGTFIGHNDGQLTQCFADGVVSGAVNTGGLAGSNNTKGELLQSFTAAQVDGVDLHGGLIGYNRGLIVKSGHKTLTEAIGNSPYSVLDKTAPDLQAAETYTEGGLLGGYDTGRWKIESSRYPELLKVKKPEQLYQVFIKETEGVQVKAEPDCAANGTIVTIKLVISAGQVLDRIAAEGVVFTKVDNDTYTFTMPEHNVTISTSLKGPGGSGSNSSPTSASYEDTKAAEVVDQKIEAIGKVTLHSKDAIEAAKKAYESLTEKQKSLVTGKSALDLAVKTYGQLVSEETAKKAAQKVSSQINAIGRVTVNSKKKIDAARAAYNALTPQGKRYVSNYSKLTTAEKAYRALANAPKKGAKYNVGLYQYQITNANITNGTVTLLKPLNKQRQKAIIPATVKIKDNTYKITAIGSKAFKNGTKLTSVSIGKYVKTIGQQAFYGNKALKKITFSGMDLRIVGKQAFKGVHKNVVIKVPGKKVNAYKKLLNKGGLPQTAIVR